MVFDFQDSLHWIISNIDVFFCHRNRYSFLSNKNRAYVWFGSLIQR